MSRHFLEPLLTPGHPVHHLRIERTGEVVASEIELAADSKSRNRGLLGRSSLAPGHALIIAPCNAIHTFFMRFPIDIVFVDRLGRVRKVYQGVAPWRARVAVGAFAALELAAGSLAGTDIKPGDQLLLSQTL